VGRPKKDTRDYPEGAVVVDRLLEAYGVETLAQLAESVGEKPSTVKNWRYRGAVPKAALIKATKDTQRSLDWLLTGAEPALSFGRISRNLEKNAPSAHLPAAHKSALGSTRPVTLYTRRTGESGAFEGVMEPPPSGAMERASTMVRFGGVLALPAVFEVVEQAEREYVVIPSIEVAARAGTASSMKAEQERIAACVAGVMAMDRAWMTQQLGREDGGFATITVTGNSMLPTLHDGDTIIIDTMVTTIDTDGIYVLRRGAQLVIKRIKVLMDESAIVSGDNEAYGPGEKLQPATLRELRAVGRMVWPRLR
jgi:hypothetical protein